ncbi:nucleoside triphosphate pyrophosphohydrolase [Thaumasiovibrio sp. DFM-14]|uniref:nucleoside triphosphate pyrophosphohydrolase n=1 Tax=Thaumasiovibrio sp. DFM-14 TaxID=3384792 RepID=UPI0039A142DE
MSNSTPLNQLLTIMETLRDPERGCPWDRQQDFETIAPHTLEEVYEVIDAIQQRNWDELKEELGDLLFQIIFYCQLGKEQHHFDLDDVIKGLNDKLIRRHPHVFSDVDFADQVAIKANWEQEKAKEREQKGQSSVLDNVPHAMPALLRAEKLQKRCAQHGFDWDSIGPVVEKVHEEIDEVMEEVTQVSPSSDRVEDEIGDLLFSVVNLARHAKVKPEIALARANKKFERRFREVEKSVLQEGKQLVECDLETLDNWWRKVKENEADNKS